MTDQHRATPEQWTHVAICAEMKQQVPWATAACLLELRARVEALEQQNKDLCIAVNNAVVWNTEQSQRIEALEAAPQDKLDRLIALDAADPTPDPAMTELRAASAEARPAGRLVERVLAPEWVLQKDQTRKTTDGAQLIDGKWWAPCSDLFSMQRIVDNARSLIAYTSPPTAPAPAGSLVERVGNSVLPGVIDGELNTVARAAIREVVSALRNHAKSPHIRVMTFEAAADWLELEADRG